MLVMVSKIHFLKFHPLWNYDDAYHVVIPLVLILFEYWNQSDTVPKS